MGTMIYRFAILCVIALATPIVAGAQVRWENLHGPTAGSATARRAMLDSAGNTLIVAGSDLFRLDRTGDTLVRIFAGWDPQDDRIREIRIASSGTLYVEHTLYDCSYSSDEIYRSSDGGLTWQNLSCGFEASFQFGEHDAVYFSDPEGTLLQSTDDGAIWRSVAPVDSLPEDGLAAMLVVDRDTILVVAGQALYRCLPSRPSVELLDSTHGITTIAFDDNGGLTALDTDRRVLRSSDGGATWRALDSIAPQPPDDVEDESGDGTMTGQDSVHEDSIGVDVRGVAIGALRSEDDDGTVILATNEAGERRRFVLGFADAHDLWVAPNGTIFDACTEGLLASTDNGLSWTNVAAGPSIVEERHALRESRLDRDALWCAPVELPGGRLVAGAEDGLYASRDGGRTWTLDNPDIVGCVKLRADPIRGSIAVCDTTIWRSDNGGRTWTPTFLWLNDSYVTDVLLLGDGVVLAACSDGILRSTDNGDTWELDKEVFDPEYQRRCDDGWTMETDGAGHVVAASGRHLLSSGDNGATWRHTIFDTLLLDNDNGDDGPDVRFITAADGTVSEHFVDEEEEEAGDGERHGESEPIRFGRMTLALSRAVCSILWLKDGTLLIASTTGVFRSRDGLRWECITNGLYDQSFTSLAIDSTGALLAAAQNGPIYREARAPAAAAPVAVAAPAISVGVAPNPAFEDAVLSFTLPSSGHATLDVIDATGTRVGMLCEDDLGAGEHHYAFPGPARGAVASGVYMARLRTSSGLAMVRFLVVR